MQRLKPLLLFSLLFPLSLCWLLSEETPVMRLFRFLIHLLSTNTAASSQLHQIKTRHHDMSRPKSSYSTALNNNVCLFLVQDVFSPSHHVYETKAFYLIQESSDAKIGLKLMKNENRARSEEGKQTKKLKSRALCMPPSYYIYTPSHSPAEQHVQAGYGGKGLGGSEEQW